MDARARGWPPGRRAAASAGQAARADLPSADLPRAGTPKAGTPKAGTPTAGTPKAGTPTAGTPVTAIPRTCLESCVTTPEFVKHMLGMRGASAERWMPPHPLAGRPLGRRRSDKGPCSRSAPGCRRAMLARRPEKRRPRRIRRQLMTAVIEVTGLTKRYAGQAVVDGISFQVEQGEIFGILGPNGAGKTTAVECMEGLRKRDGGEVRVLGLDPRIDGRRLHQRIGVQLQQTQLQDKLTACEALELYASFYPHPADWRDLLERWGLESKSRTQFSKLSGGQKQRLFIALALVGHPEVVFLDELTAGLDPGARRATWDLIRQVRDGGVTVVLVSHFMDEVEELCDRAAILEQGRIAALDTPAGLVDLAGGEYQLRFKPTAALDEGSLRLLPGVTGVSRRGPQVIVTGTGDFASAVTADLARRQIIVADLRIEGRSLDNAYVTLTGKRL